MRGSDLFKQLGSAFFPGVGAIWKICNEELLNRARVLDDPFQVAYLYRDHAYDLPPELLDILLDSLEAKLEAHLTGPNAEKSGSFSRQLSLLADAVLPAHADLLQARRGSKLEQLLSKYLYQQGPQRGLWWNGHEREPGLEILRRMNGDGFTKVINEFLTCDDRHGRLNALEWAMKRPDETTFELAAERALSEELWDKIPLEQNHALELLSAHAQWKAVSKGLCRWGMETHRCLTENRLVPQGFAAKWLDDLRQDISKNATVGNVVALAFAGSEQDAERLHSVLEASDPESKLAHACVVGLEMLEDRSDRGVSLVAKHLQVSSQEYSARCMLSAAGTPAAWHALFERLRVSFDHINALNLLNLSEHAAEVAKLVVKELPSDKHFGSWDFLRILICELRHEGLKQQILSDRWLRDTFHREAVAAEGSSWISGSKAAAIECLAQFDGDAAFLAAQRALTTRGGHDRERYPFLLYQIDASRAVSLFLDLLAKEQSGHVRYAIGRVLGDVELEPQLLPCFQSADAKNRAAACFAAGWAKDGERLAVKLQEALEDRDEIVIPTAVEALDRLRERAIASELAKRATISEDLVQKWLYLDALIDVMDPGEDFQRWPSVLRSASENVSSLVCKHLNNRLEKRRKKLHDDLDKKSKDK